MSPLNLIVRTATVTAVLGCLLIAPQTANALPNPLITVDENGNGTLLFPGGSPIPTHGVLQADPGPGGLSSVMTYNLLGPPSLVAGDVLLTEGVGGPVFDVVRFNPAGTGSPSYAASLLFYSDNVDGFDALADTPSPPGSFYTNTITIPELGTELDNGAIYTPTAGEPGFVAGFSVTYDLISDVPEPPSWSLLGVALIGLLGARSAGRYGLAPAA
jgi:hypothetical protein